MNPLRFSIIIPAYNEEMLLPRLLDSIEAARAAYSGGRHMIEVIVADNCSTDGTASVAADHGVRVVGVARRRIGAVRNGGANVSRGEVLCFIDADSAIHPETFNAIDLVMRTGRFVGGTTGINLERTSLGVKITYTMMMFVALITGLDTGVVFCNRDDFHAIEGYDEDRPYAEDVQFLLDLRKRGRRDGRRLTRVPAIKALVCTRKFDQFGDWHFFWMLGHAIKGLLSCNLYNEKFARRYWYESGR
jgi:glycosyltransferase involved in cell wall biosynthesis